MKKNTKRSIHIFPTEDEQYCSSFSYGILLPYDKILIMNKKTINRWIIYGIGMITLALGLTLNTKAAWAYLQLFLLRIYFPILQTFLLEMSRFCITVSLLFVNFS